MQHHAALDTGASTNLHRFVVGTNDGNVPDAGLNRQLWHCVSPGDVHYVKCVSFTNSMEHPDGWLLPLGPDSDGLLEPAKEELPVEVGEQDGSKTELNACLPEFPSVSEPNR